jgi:hypothetical protein
MRRLLPTSTLEASTTSVQGYTWTRRSGPPRQVDHDNDKDHGVALSITFSASRLAGIFAAIVALLVSIHAILQVVRFATGDHSLMGLLALFSLGAENNVPATYSGLAILCCAGFLAIIGLAEARRPGARAAHWFGLSLIFLFLAADEMMALHERLNDPMRSELGTSGAFHYGWVIPYAAALALFVVAYVPFLLRLPRRTATLFVIAGGVYVSGAIGAEMVSGAQADRYGTLNVTYVVWQTIEEIMEMSGIVVFLYALAGYAERRLGVVELRLAPNAGQPFDEPAVAAAVKPGIEQPACAASRDGRSAQSALR